VPSNGADTFHSGFVAIVGRPNVGKSTMLNAIVGRKVSIVSDKPQTTRTQVRAVRTTDASQLVFLDTPGVHRPRTLLGERGNQRALATLQEVDVVCFVIEANAPIGPGDRFVAERLAEVDTPVVLALNKIDAATHDEIGQHLAVASGELGDFAAYVPVSARTANGLDALVRELEARVPEGPHYYPDDVVTDQPESFLAAELLREQLLKVAREELPHSIAVNTDDVEERRTSSGEPLLAVRVIVRVERESQKGIVIGKGGAVLKEVGTLVREQLPDGMFIELFVRVDKDWQRKADIY
jgi:GTP-binding protein Era